MYEMNYKSLIYCLVEIEIQFMKIYIFFFKLSSLPLFLCGVCFVLLKLQWSCIARKQRI